METCWNTKWEIVVDSNCFFNPIENTQYLLVSWRMSGSEFSKNVIWENFSVTQKTKIWGKAHTPLRKDILDILVKAKTKIFFIICDPRDMVTHILNHENGFHYHPDDYSQYAKTNRNSLIFLDENIDIMFELIDYYKNNFGDDMIILRYEDAVMNQQVFLKQVSRFLNTEPLYVNDAQKFNSPIHKNIGVYSDEFHDNIIKKFYLASRYKRKIDFFKKWGYING